MNKEQTEPTCYSFLQFTRHKTQLYKYMMYGKKINNLRTSDIRGETVILSSSKEQRRIMYSHLP